MYIKPFAPIHALRVLNRLNEFGLHYGGSASYASLLTPSSTLITEAEVQDLQEDLTELCMLYEIWQRIYLDSLESREPAWIASLSESGLSETERRIQRETAKSVLRPSMARVDYISMGSSRKISEVQWKSGGPGLFFWIRRCLCFYSRFREFRESAGRFGE